MGNYYLTKSKKETAVLVALSSKYQDTEQTKEYLDELSFLATTIGVVSIKSFIQKAYRPDTRTFVGKGKLEEIKTFIKARDVDVVIFDDDLTPSQLRNLEKELEIKIYDRSLLILDIFLLRAKTSQARTQVELARNQYLLPRLTRMWTHLERQRGGTGTVGGAGEKEIETDRRIIRNQISVLKKKLQKIEKQASTQRKSRGNIAKVALVGYTNVGKSTIMKVLTKADVFAEDKLFATVDSTVRKVVLERIPFLLSDTVGFIRKLPHTLIESFKSTLDEVLEADILLHVVDVSHAACEEQIKVVNDTLEELGALNKPVIMVFNKIDRMKAPEEPQETEEPAEPEGEISEGLQENSINSVSSFPDTQGVSISATKKLNIEELRKVLMDEVRKVHMKIFPNYLPENNRY